MIANSAPSKYTLGTTPMKSAVAVAPVKAKMRRNNFLNRPWSAAADMEMIRRAWIKTLMEKVYIAKLAVFISAPRKLMTHAGSSLCLCLGSSKTVVFGVGP